MTFLLKRMITMTFLLFTKIERQNTDLGSLKLITVCSATDFMDYSTLCGSNESPFYIKEMYETRTPKSYSVNDTVC
jgi:hypothetical protein